jgi:hypothetical protein
MNITIELENWMYAAIASKAQDLGCSEGEIIQQAIKLMLGTDESSLTQILELFLENKLEDKIEEKLKEFELRSPRLENFQTKSEPIPAKPELPLIIRPLQVGDLVQIRDQSSPHFLERLHITKVGMLMATVVTSLGEQSFLKRDLRFIESSLLDK